MDGTDGEAGVKEGRRGEPAADPGRLDDQEVTRARNTFNGAGASDAPALVKLSEEELLLFAGGS